MPASMPASMPVAALTVLGIIIAVLGLLVGDAIELVVLGLVAIATAGVLQAVGVRRA